MIASIVFWVSLFLIFWFFHSLFSCMWAGHRQAKRAKEQEKRAEEGRAFMDEMRAQWNKEREDGIKADLKNGGGYPNE